MPSNPTAYLHPQTPPVHNLHLFYNVYHVPVSPRELTHIPTSVPEGLPYLTSLHLSSFHHPLHQSHKHIILCIFGDGETLELLLPRWTEWHHLLRSKLRNQASWKTKPSITDSRPAFDTSTLR